MKIQAKNNAFTLIEMLGVLIIVALLLSISVVSFRHSQAKARDVVRKTDLQMIADALISYANDHGHFPSSIYDNGQQALTISQALNSITEGGTFQFSEENGFSYQPGEESIPYLPEQYFKYENIEGGSYSEGEGGDKIKVLDLEKLESDKNNDDIKDVYDSIASTIETFENETPVPTFTSYEDYSIVTQGMCVASLRKYLVNEGYLSEIPQDPSGESINLQTNICAAPGIFQGGVNANDTGWSIQGSSCFAKTNLGCTQICKEGYVYVSDGEHFALIAHMESENGGNYETTACGSCEIEKQCKHTEGKAERTKIDQLPCDITDEFTNSFACIQDNGVVEYSTGEYYFYIY